MNNSKESIDPRTLCRCCGWSFGDYFPWGEDGMSPEYAICDCCACESGYEDAAPNILCEYRENWIRSGMPWFNQKAKPENWNLNSQMKNLPEKYRNPDDTRLNWEDDAI